MRAKSAGRRSIPAFGAAFFVASWAIPWMILPATAATAPTSMNLSSGSPATFADSRLLHNAASATISVGGAHKVVTVGTPLSAAELVAVQQVLSTGHQTIKIDPTGVATGGVFNLGALGSHFSNLVIPSQVKTLDPSTRALIIDNQLTTAGALIGLPGSTVFSIKAGDVSVLTGGSISTLGTRGLNLAIQSQNDITNFGSILSAGSLSLKALGTITNGAGGVISAEKAVTLGSSNGQFFNNGLISSHLSSINFRTASPVDLTLNNVGGQINALLGNINIGNPNMTEKIATNLLGGSFSAKKINVYGGDGDIEGNVDAINGVLNEYGGLSHVIANSPLTLGTIKLSGDPTFVVTVGDLTLANNLVFPGQNLALIAAGNVVAGANLKLIDVSSTTGNGGVVNIVSGFSSVAGATDPNHQLQPGFTAKLTALSNNGGSINLDGVSIKSGTSAAGMSGGSVRLYAAANNGTGGDITVGTIDASAPKGQGGTILSEAPGTSVFGLKIQNGPSALVTSGAVGGAIGLLGAQPTIPAGNEPTFDATGTLTTGQFGLPAASNTADIAVMGKIDARGLKGNGGGVAIATGHNINTGDILTSSSTAQGGSIVLTSSTGQAIVGALDASGADNVTNTTTQILVNVSANGNFNARRDASVPKRVRRETSLYLRTRTRHSMATCSLPGAPREVTSTLPRLPVASM